MNNSSLLELLTDHLKDVYDAEKQLVKALPRIAKAVSDEEFAQGLRDHATQTQEQVRRLENVFETLGMKARSKPCSGMKGLVQESQEIIEEQEEQVLDLSLFEAARKVEHYEMVAYEALINAAQSAKQPEVANLLRQTFQEESQMDRRLIAVGKRLMKESTGAQGREAAPVEDRKEKSRASSNGKSRGKGASTGGNLSTTTTDRDEIRQWAEERGGKPACVKGTGGKGDIGLLRIEFPGKPNADDDKLAPISWEDFFDKFEERGLALVYQKETASGQKSNFNKLVARGAEAKSKTRAAR